MRPNDILSLHRAMVRSVRGEGAADPMSDAEDHAQAAWCKLLERGEEREVLVSLPGFAVGMCRQMSRMSSSRRGRRKRLEALFAAHLLTMESAHEPATRLDDERARAAMARFVASLDEPRRWLLQRRLLEGRAFAALLPAYQDRFGEHIRTVEGLRTAVFHLRKGLVAALDAALSQPTR